MENELRTEIKFQSSQAVKLSQQALQAALAQDFRQAQALMKQAAEAGRNCRAMLESSIED